MTDPFAAPSPPEAPAAGPTARRPSAPDDVWAAVKADYLSGLSAPACCGRYGVGLSTLRERAAREGWRRMDQPWTPPNRLDPEDEGVKLEVEVFGDLDRVEPRQLSYVAWRRMLRAVMRGDAVAALRWRRVQEMLDVDQAELDRMIEQEESLRRYYGEPSPPPDGPDGPDRLSRPSGSGPRPDGPDGLDGVSPPSGRTPAPPAEAGVVRVEREGGSDGAAGQD